MRLPFRPTFWPTVFTVPAILVMIGLAIWQVQRLHWKEDLIAQRVSRTTADPIPLPPAGTDLSSLEFRRVTVTGTAHVTWSLADKSRRVEHELTWTRISDGLEGTGTGDRTQTLLEGGLAEGIQVDGHRSWKSNRGQWDLAINAVQIRWVDPVPQAGTYTLSNPAGKSLSRSFKRVDDATIKVTVANGKKSFDFDVKSIGGGESS